jgi:hypothetical protein
VTLPLYPGMGEEKVDFVADAVIRTIGSLLNEKREK